MANGTPLDAATVESLMDVIGQMDATALNKEIVRSLGDVVGFDKDDSISKPFLVNDEDGEEITLYNSYTGLSSTVTRPMLARLMTRKFGPQHVEVPKEYWGKRIWTATKPVTNEPTRMPCLFSVDAPERDAVVAAGLGHIMCRKSNIPNEGERQLHAQHTHRASYRTYKEAIARTEANEDRAAQREMLNVIAELARARVTNDTPSTLKVEKAK